MAGFEDEKETLQVRDDSATPASVTKKGVTDRTLHPFVEMQ
jgi:hypothetical protein